MTEISRTALQGLAQATQKLARATQDVAESAVTGADTTRALLGAKTSVMDYRANAKVLELDKKRQDALMDILA